MGRSKVVGINTCYALDGPGVEFRWREIFPTLSDRSWDQPIILYDGRRVPFLGIKRPARGFDYLLPYNAEVKERIESYLYSHSGPS
jgi:hypothetical protein